MNLCPICTCAIESHSLMCYEHWHLVPWDIKQEVQHTRNQFRSALAIDHPLDGDERKKRCAIALREAQQRAIDSVLLIKSEKRA